MSRLTVYPDTDPKNTLLQTTDAQRIAETLAGIGVVFERWQAAKPLPDDADQASVLDVYRKDVDRLMAQGGYRTVDVVRVKPDHPDRVALRAKFLAEHTHAEDEVRFFVEGAGAFYLRQGGKVYQVVCERNDLLSVPAGITHWFDTGEAPQFCAIRLFTSADGWVATFTGDDIATRFPAYENRV